MTRSPRTTRSARVATGALAALLIGMTVLPGAAAAPVPRAAASSETAKSDPVTLAALFDNNNGDGDPFGGSNFGAPGPPTITMAEIRAARAAEQAARRAAQAARRAAHARAIAAHRAANAARRAAKAQAAANRRAAQRAASAASALANWNRTGRPNQLVIVRGRHIDLVVNGRMTNRVVRAAGPLTLATLAKYLPAGWLSLPGNGSAQLTASVVLTAGTLLDNGPDVHVLNLASGPNSNTAAGLWVGHATLNLHGLTVNAVDPPAGTPAATAQRGFLVAGNGGTLNVADATLTNLGAPPPVKPVVPPAPAPSTRAVPGARTPPTPAPAPVVLPAGTRNEPGIAFSPGSTGSVVRSTLKGNGIGLKLAGSRNVHLDTVTMTQSKADGLVLRGDQGTTMKAVHSQHNAGNGVLVNGASSPRPISGFDTLGNQRFGLAVIRQNQPQISNVTSVGDQAGGVRLTATTGAAVTNVSSTDSPVGLIVNGGSNHLKLTGVHTRGGLRGIVATGGVSALEIASAQVTDAGRAGIAVAATDANLHQLTISGSTTGLQISGRAARTTVTDAHVSGGHTGIRIAEGASVVALNQVTTDGVSGTGISTAAPGTKITNARVTGGTTGINARAAADITSTSVSGVNEAIHSGPAVQVTGKKVDLLAAATGVKVDPNGVFLLTDSRVRAHLALRGQVDLFGANTISPPPFNWVGAFGVLFIALAFLLELAHFIRQRRKVRVAFAPVKRAVPVPATATAPAPAPVAAHVVVTPAMASAVAGGTVAGNTVAGGGRGESLLEMEPPTEAIPIVAPPSTPTVAPPSTPTTGVKWPASPRRAAAARATIERADEPAFFEPVAAEPAPSQPAAGEPAASQLAAETGPAADLGQDRPDPAAESEPEPAAGESAGRRPSPRPRSRTMRPSPRPRPTPYRRSNAPAAESNATDTATGDQLETHSNGTGPSDNGDRTVEAPVAVDAPNTGAEANRHDDTEDPEIRAAS
ncbi:right-handed parallel beta-helix repeat-containing protein [Pseudonocardia sp. Cha107L01]|uniref:right-handed parallel beta-helix repeat-containing protein n=1 Tax=Pseudonocardia sp. Cha107L01 TaxID=3457576 RepID=UPI00403E63E9